MLATHVLQFMFLGYTGFKWPVAYFATTEAHASELMLLVWEVMQWGGVGVTLTRGDGTGSFSKPVSVAACVGDLNQ